MASLNNIDIKAIEEFFCPQKGYLLGFTNATFQQFVHDVVGVDIYDQKYEGKSGSKANRLWKFFEIETNKKAAVLLKSLIENRELYIDYEFLSNGKRSLLQNKCIQILKSLENGQREVLVEFNSFAVEKSFSALVDEINKSLTEDNPTFCIDRLHTFTVKYLRSLCGLYKIPYDENHPIYSLLGSYVKHVKKTRGFDSEVTELILKSSISIITKFNDVRNNQSPAHDNVFLNYEESKYIVNVIISMVEFIVAYEKKHNQSFLDNKTKTD